MQFRPNCKGNLELSGILDRHSALSSISAEGSVNSAGKSILKYQANPTDADRQVVKYPTKLIAIC